MKLDVIIPPVKRLPATLTLEYDEAVDLLSQLGGRRLVTLGSANECAINTLWDLLSKYVEQKPFA